MSNLQKTDAVSWGPEHERWANDPRTMIEVLERAVAGGKGIVHIKPDGSEVYQSYADLLSSAQRVLGGLRARGLQPGDKVMVEVQDSHRFLPVFWGCLLGGFIAAPMQAPSSFNPDSHEMRKTQNVWMLMGESLIVCDEYMEKQYQTLKEHPLFSNLNLATAEGLLAHEPDLNHHQPHPDDIAFLLFTSGSAGNAGGVELSHAKLIFRCGAMAQCYEYSSEDVVANWVPLDHDMGLICFHLTGVMNGLKQIQMSHDTFPRCPELLLRKITEHKATVSGSPSSGLESITTKVQDLSGFDLSSLRVFYNGAEPISVQAKEAFEDKLAVCGLRKHVVSCVTGQKKGVFFVEEDMQEFELSSGQRGLWFIQQMDPESVTYNEHYLVKITGELDVTALDQTLREIVERHPILRTVFVSRDGHPKQIVRNRVDFGLTLFEGADLAAVEKALFEDLNTPFDLAQGPLIRFKLFKTSEQEFYFYLIVHHIIFDGVSVEILFSEMSDIYTAKLQGQPSQLPIPNKQYAEFSEWQQQQFETPKFQKKQAFWQEHLAKPLPVLDLPTDFPRPPQNSEQGAILNLPLPEDFTQQLMQACDQINESLYAVMISAYFVWLHRVTQETDLIIGSPFRGRTERDVRDVMGYFVNTLPIRVNLEGATTFADVLSLVRRRLFSVMKHQDYPVDMIVTTVNPERDPSRPVLFSTVFNVQSAPVASIEGLDMEVMDSRRVRTISDLTWHVMQKEDNSLRLDVVYNVTLFKAESVKRFITQFENILQAIIQDVNAPIREVALLTDYDRAMYEALNDTEVEYDLDHLLTDAFVEQAEAHPERVALICEGQTMTYGELHERSNRLAHFLRDQGVERNQLVGIMMERSFELMVGFYGILKSGAAYVPIDPEYPAERVQYMLEDSGAHVLLTKQAYLKDTIDLPTVLLMEEGLNKAPDENAQAYVWRDLENLPTTMPEPVHAPTDLAYMIYTSGSTGQPKGVQIQHKAILNRLYWHQDTFQATPDDVAIQRTTMCFDPSVIELFWPLRHGASLSLMPQDTVLDPKRLIAQLKRDGATYMQFVPSLLSVVVAALQEMPAEERPQLRAIITSGEALPANLVQQWFEMFPGSKLANLYGPTEAAVDVTHVIYEAGVNKTTIGRPVSNTQAYVLNEAGQLCPVNVKGELYIGGAQLGVGYHNKPDKTAEAFVPNHLAGTPGDRLYRTGDAVRLLPDGSIEYLGRNDDQVKIRGMRMELGEIEAALMEQESIQKAVVIVHEVAPGDKRLAAYVVLDGDASADVSGWQAHLRERVPSYMVPSAFVVLDAIPLTPNGKVNRRGLPKPDASAFATEEYVAPRTAVEERVANVWAEVLRVDRIGVHDNFFAAGGHSLLATQVMSRLAGACSVQVPLKVLFEAPTIAELAAQIERLQGEQQAEEEIPLIRASREEAMQLSYAQQRMWVLDRLMGDKAAGVYNMPGAIRLQGALNAEALERAIREVIDRHDVLRSAFVQADGEPVQVTAESPVALERIDRTACPADERAEQVKLLMQEESLRLFDLEVGPLVRALLVQFAEDEHALILNFHHIVYDGWSMDVLLKELSQLYTAFAAGEATPLAPLPIQYADYAVWQRKWLENGAMKQQLGYWKEKLDGLSVLELPTDHPRPPVQTYKGHMERFELRQELTEALQTLSQQNGATLYMTLLSAFQTLLARYSGQDDIAVGTPIAGRQRRELEALIGFFVNTLVMRADLSGEPSFREVLNRVRASALEAYAHQDVPFEKLVEELQPERDMSRTPLFQVLFVLQNNPSDLPKFGDLGVELMEPDSRIAKFDLTLYIYERGGELSGSIEYNTDLFDKSTIERMIGHFRNLLEGVAANPDLPIGQLDILTEQDHAAYARLNDTDAEYDLDHLLLDAFVEQAEAQPERVALLFEGRMMTYGELHERSNRIAHYLRAQGVERNQLVGIMMERSLELMVGFYGILKSGGAYVPIDPEYPEDRIEYMLADSGARVLLTKQAYLASVPEGTAVLLMDEELANYPATMPKPVNEPSDLAYMIYTSGSTGQPKGVLIQHAAILNRLYWHQEVFKGTPEDVVVQRTTMCFDDSVIELFWPLRHGAALSIMPQDVVLDPQRMIGQLNRDGATYMQFVPSLLSVMVAGAQEIPAADRPKLRAVIVSGEALPPTLVQQWFDLFPGTQLANLYGPTEAAVDVTGAIYEAVPARVTIGTPTTNTQIYVLDASGQLCPVNVKGELYVGGVQLAVGYHNKPEKTAEAFVPNHLAGTPGDRLYRTGDAVRLLPDGTIEYLGRSDDQVKIRGMRIELGEIEAALMEHEAIQTAVVLVHEAARGDKRLVAYVVLESNATEDAALWQAHLRELVPAYMVPSAFLMLESLPLTPNGKVNRRGLPKPDASAFAQEEYVAPRTEVEAIVAKIWADVLHLEKIGAHDNFFAAGGHSLLATQVMSRLAAACSVQVPLLALFESPTVAELAAHVESLQKEQRASEQVPLARVSREQPLPLSFAQQRLWVLDRLMTVGEKASYNLSGAMHLHGPLQVEALEQAIAEILDRHEALRTTFAEVDGEPVQVIAQGPVGLDMADLSVWPEAEREEEVNRLVREEANRSFDLAVGPLARFSLVRMAEDHHALILNFHHIIFDGWSTDLFVNELIRLYTAFAAGEPSPLAPLPIQYADYSVWQRNWLEGDVLQEQLAYWSGKLANLPALQLPTDRPRPPVQTHNGKMARFVLANELTDALQALSREQGATLYMTLLGAFQTLLSRYSGQDDIVIGTPIAGRGQQEAEELIGFFVNTLVMRTDLSGAPSFRDVLNRVRATALEAYAHQDVPFEKLVEELQPERDLSRSPLFQVMFVLQNTPMKQAEHAGLQYQLVPADTQVSKFDLTMSLAEQEDGGLSGSIEYNTDLFDEATIERMTGHFRTLLEGIAAHPEQPVHLLPVLTEREQHQLLVEWNDKGAEYPQEAVLAQLFEAQVEKTPDAVAVQFEGESLTYRELNERANRLAHFLRKTGVGPDVMVGVSVERSPEVAVALYGITKAGGVYLPIDPTYPSDRIALTLEDAQAAVLLTKEHLLSVLPEHQAHVICLDRDWVQIATESEENPECIVTGSNLAYTIYTSGSTGKPKGVLLEHAALTNALFANQSYMKMQASDVLVSVTSISFDPAVLDLCLPLVNGAAVVIVSRETATDGVQLAALLTSVRATVMQATAATWNMLLQAGWSGHAPLRVVCGGEALSRELILALSERTQEIWNAYGPTEAAICTTAAQMMPDQESVVIGRPLANYTTYILDANRQPVPVGVVGELHIGGRGLARGYLNRPDLTAEAFVIHQGERLYKTGDLARYHANGEIELLGRADSQVKIRGFRIELGEIESVLMQHESVQEAAVIVHEVSEGDKRLAAYLVLDAEPSDDAADWKSYLRERVPSYMVPSVFVMLEAMPLSPNGKVDRKALPVPDASAFRSEEYVAPRNAREETVAAIWADVLRMETVGVHDNFFEAGGHSLLATQVMSRLGGAFGVQVPLKMLFEAPTVAELAAEIERLQQQGQQTAEPALERVSREQPLPLSFAQQRLWVVDRLLSQGTGATYNIPAAMKLEGALNADALERAFREVVLRHEVLRTTFAERDGEPVQVIADSVSGLERIDLRASAEEDREAQVNRLLEEEVRRPFDLATGPLVRAALVQVRDEEHMLILNFHHIIFDGWSVDVLFNELVQLYAAFAAGEESPLAPLPIQYADYAVWQRQWLEGEVMNEQLAYWSRKLADLPVLHVPTDRPRPSEQTYEGNMQQFALTAELTDALQALSQQQGATLYMTLLGAFQTLLARYSGQEDIVVGTPIAGRHRGEVEELIGFFVNTLVIRTDLSGAPNFREVLARVRETALEAYAHQDLPFEKVVEELQPERDPSRTPLFQVMFVLQNTQMLGETQFADLKMNFVEPENAVAKFDLTLSMWEQSGVLHGGIEYNTDLFDAETVERMAGHLRVLLEGIAANPELPIDQVPLLTEPERRQLLVEWNDTRADYPQDVLVHQFVEAQAEKTPDRIAVRFEDKSLTYRELNEQSNRVAHRLQKMGVGPDVFVGLMVERSLEMAIGILATVKAGGAYVPLDPAYPSDRLAHMMEDAQVPVLLTQEPLLNQLPAHQAEVLCFERDRAEIEAEPAMNPATAATVDNLIYVIFTSGSTGRPKGVQIEHRALSNYLFATNEYMRVSESDVMVAVFSMSFDPAASDLFLPLMNGGTSVIASRETTTDGVPLGALLDEVEATVMMATPATWSMLVQSGWKGRSQLRMFSGGEAFPRELINTLADITHEVWNIYGPTESTILCTMSRMEKGNGTILIGSPFNNTTAYILDKHMQPVPIGVAGEIYVGGRQLARGYLNRPDLTAASFLSNPFEGREGERLYKTGDLGRFHANGEIEPLGRIDGQVKIRGFRIELGEIEAVLDQHESVQESVVVVHDVAGDKRLVAYLVLHAGATADVPAWKAHLRERVPAFMVPSAFMVVDAMPLTPNRKVDRKALPVPDFFGGQEEYVAPSTALEQTVAEIWADVLHMERIGVNDNFFEVGGHSLLATQVMSRLTAACSVKVPLKALFEAPTVGELASCIEELQQEQQQDAHEMTSIQRASREQALPLSFAQQRLWVLDRLMSDGAGAVYNVPGALRLLGALNAEALERALQEIVERHEVLRTTFAQADAEPMQVIADGQIKLEKADLRTLPSEAREEQVARLFQAEVERPFHLAVGPLARFSLLQLADDEHVLILNFHHIVFDGWSMDVLFHELVQLYAAFAAGEESPLAPLAIQYADYSVWQREWLAGEVLQDQLAYWSDKLANLPVLQLPTDRPRPAVQTHNGRTQAFELTKELTDALQTLSQEQGATLYMTLLGAFQTLLSRYSGQEDIVVGTPIAGRHHREVEELIGFFVNTLVMRTDLSGNPTFRDVLSRVRETALSAYANQDVPLEKLVEELQPERDLSRTPLFQVFFVLQNAPLELPEFADLKVEVMEAESNVAKFDLTLAMIERDGVLQGGIEYNTDLFDAATIERMTGHFRTLLEGIAANPETPVQQLPTLTEREQYQLLVEWNATETDYPQNITAHELFEAQVVKTPDKTAVVCEGKSLTYRELNEQANRVAHLLQKQGVGPDVLVGVMFERSVDMVVGILAALKAGGAYLPLDPSYPADRLTYLLEDSQVTVLLTQEGLVAELDVQKAQVLCFDRDQADFAYEPATNPSNAATPESLMYVIYTSGSTGKPKGVQIQHSALVNFLFASQEFLHMQESDVLVSVTSISFDPTVIDLFLPLVNGATVVVATRETASDGLQLAALLDEAQATIMQATPATWNMLLQTGWQGRKELRIMSGGDAFPRDVINALAERTSGVINAYGPTEATIISTSARMEVSDEPVHIGRPLHNTTAYILDKHLQPVPVGVAGELYVGGRQLARGYLNRPDLTEAAFLPHPFAEGERLYKTGDLARYHANGQIEHMGRADNQVKIRGYRIELGEIESVLMQYESILDAAVVVHEVAAGDKRLAAYLVIDGAEDAKGWKSHLRDRLPTFMMPSAFVVMESLPLTPNGKVDRKALPMPETFGTGSEEYVAPRTALEETVAAIWADVLRVDPVGIHDNFFEAGGHSLLATQVLSRLAGACSVQVPLKALFEAPTVAELSAHIERLQQEQNGLPVIPFERVSREEPLPMSFAQQRLWVLDRLMGGGTTYNMPGAMRLEGALNAEALERALNEIAVRHEVLRTTFAEVDGEPVQVIADSIPALEKVDLRSYATEEREARVHSLLRAEADHVFDLTVGPLVRFTLVQMAEEEHVLLSNFHHIVFDGWSMDVLFQELLHLYTAFAAGEEPSLAPLALQYADFAVWQRKWLEGDVLNGQLAYWNEKLYDLPVLQLPTDRPRPTVQTYNGAMQRFELSQELTDALQALSQGQGATMYMTLLGAFQTLLARYSGQDDIAVGTPIAGRHYREVEELIGFFVNTLVMRTDLTGAPSFLDVLNRVRETALSAYANQDVPFEKLVEQLQPERDMSRTPLFQVMFVLQNIALGAPKLADLKVSTVEQESQMAKFDLTLTMWEESGVLYGGIEYNTDLFDASTIERMSGHFRTLLEGIAANPQLPVHELPILTGPEQHQLLVEWNATGADYPQDLTATQLFEAQVEKTPDNIAVTCEGVSLTYRELNEQANRVAHRLQKQGVGPDVLVGVMFERSVEMVVGILAALKAGGAYLPLDPSYPADRLTYLLEDSQVSVLLTQEALVAELDVQKARVLCFDRDQADLAAEPATNPSSAATPESLMYVIYTSGSTGKPKGVQIQHSALVNFLFASQEFLHMQESDVLVSVTSISFDPTVIDLFLPLVHGATVVVASRETASDGLQLAALLDEAEATIMQATPVTYNMLLQTGWQGRKELRIMSGGDAFPREVINALAERTAGVINAYGPTEATIISTSARMEVSDEPVHIGRPLHNTTAYILDKHLQPVPVGVAGELYVGGRQLARGYLNRPDLTESAFLPHPFAEREGERLYKTGDLARYRADGKIEHLGRVDGQVKLRGYRIELGEIESVLMAHASIQEAVVLVQEVVPGDKRLIAYLVLESGQTADVKSWKAYLRDRLPTFMVPSACVVLETLPLTPNSKVDRQALLAQRNFLLDSGAERLAPRDSLELRLTGIWQQLLGTSEFGVRDNFFELGGHSLLAVRLIGDVQREFAVKLPLSALYQEGTIEHLADLLRHDGNAVNHASLVPIRLTQSEAKPLFLVHPVFGTAQPYIELAQHLGDRSIYGLQAKGIDDDQELLTRIEEMAAFYLEEIRSVQPEGPYQIAGWSVGGVIAVEMALQLRNQGESVSYLGLLDTMFMVKDMADDSVYERMGRQEFRYGLLDYLGAGFGSEELPSERLDEMTVEEEIEWFVTRARALGVLPSGLDVRQLAKTYRIMQNNILADRNYIPSGKVEHLYLYKASEHVQDLPATIPWSEVTERLDIHEVPGSHQTMAKLPHAAKLAEKMRQGMERKLREQV